MTSQTHNDDNVDEASSLLTIVPVSSAPSFSLSQNGVASKKNGAPMMRAVIATTCFLLGTLAVLFSGGSGSSSSNTASSGVLSVALLLGQNQAASVYDPSHDWCFTDHDNPGKLCWYPIHRYPCGSWGGVGMRLMVSVVTSVPTFIVTFRLEVAPAFMNRTRVNVMTTANLDNIALTVLDSVAVCL